MQYLLHKTNQSHNQTSPFQKQKNNIVVTTKNY